MLVNILNKKYERLSNFCLGSLHYKSKSGNIALIISLYLSSCLGLSFFIFTNKHIKSFCEIQV